MDKTQKLKHIILSKYKSINSFSKIIDIPSTTLNSALDKGIGGMAVDRVIKICDELNIDIKTFDPISQSTISSDEQDLLNNFNELNYTGKKEAAKRVSELTLIDTYTKNETEDKVKKIPFKLKDHLTEHSNIETIAAHNDHTNEPGEIDKIMEDIEDMKNW